MAIDRLRAHGLSVKAACARFNISAKTYRRHSPAYAPRPRPRRKTDAGPGDPVFVRDGFKCDCGAFSTLKAPWGPKICWACHVRLLGRVPAALPDQAGDPPEAAGHEGTNSQNAPGV